MAIDQASIAKAAAAAISQMSQATEGAAKSQKKQNDLIREFNELAKEKIGNDKDMSENQLNFTEKINEALDKVHDNYEKISVTIEKICKELYAAIDSVKVFTKETNAAAAAVRNLKRAQKGGSSIFSGFGKILGGIGSIAKGAFGALSKGFKGFGQVAINIMDALKAHPIMFMISAAIKAFQVLKKVLSTVFLGPLKIATQFAKTMIGLPFQIMKSTAKIGHSFRTDVVETIGNAVRGLSEFVDINDGLGKSIGDMTNSSTLSLDKFKNVQSELVQLFGEGSGGLAAMVGHAGQALKDMGQFADVAGNSITKTADNFLYFYKATQSLGMAGDDIAYITAEAVKNGESIYSAMDSVLVSVNTTADTFGLDRKKMSKNFFELRKDITNFGHLSNSQLSETTAKLTQMGLSMKEASAVFGKIDTFESAAQTSAMLSQTFGMNLDALQLLRAEKPEEIIEQFRDAMLSTGRSFDDLNRHEKSLMASHTGLSAEALKMTMNYRTLGMSYSDIQKKMKEDDPTQQQIKNLELMSGSLKKIQKTLGGDNIFKNFTNGVLESMKAASGLSPILLRVSKRFEDFFVSGLEVSKGTKSALTKAFSPFTAVLEKMVGDGKSKKGLLDADRFKGTFEKFAQTTGGFLERVFKGEDLKNIQGEIQNSLSSAFDFKNLNKGNSIVGKLMNTSGELIGQMLKAFAAFGPGLVNTVMDSFDSLVDFLWNYKSQERGDNSVVGMLMDLFKINKEEGDIITDSFTTIIDRITASGGPLLSLIGWVNSKFIGLMVDAGRNIGAALWDSLFGYNSRMYQSFKFFALNSPLGLFFRAIGLLGDFGPFKSQEGIFEESLASNKDAALSSLNLTSMAADNYDEKQAEDVGKLYAALKNEQKSAVGQTAVQIESLIKKIDKQVGNLDFASLRSDNVIKDIMSSAAAIRGDKKSITLDVGKVKDDVTSITGSNGIGILKRTGKNKAIIKQTAVGDQTVTGKEGGPVVDAISYAGNAANALIKGMEYLMTPSNLLNLLPSSPAMPSGPSEIKIYMQVDGNNIAEAALDSGLLFKATQQKNGRYTLPGNVVVDASGNSVERTGV